MLFPSFSSNKTLITAFKKYFFHTSKTMSDIKYAYYMYLTGIGAHT